MPKQVYILVDQKPVPVDLHEWHEWMENADRVLFHTEGHTPSRVWTLTTFFLGVPACDAQGQEYLFATEYQRGPDMEHLEAISPRRLADSWETAKASHEQVQRLLRTRYSGVGA